MGCTDRLACCKQIRAGCVSQALACFLPIASSSAQPESDYRAVAIQCSDRVVELIEALIRRKRVMFFLADKSRIRFFLYDRPSDSYLSTDLETLLSIPLILPLLSHLLIKLATPTPACGADRGWLHSASVA